MPRRKAEPLNEEAIAPPITPRNFVIPGCSLTIVNQEELGLPVAELLSLVFAIAHSNPNATIDFEMTIKG